jgi:hypothetical protein
MNPLSQLFALCVAQMPGYTGHNPGMEEIAASALLFQKALNEADKTSQKQFAKKFGMTIIPRATTTSVTKTTGGATPKKQTQMQLDRFMMDSMLIEASKTKKKEASPTKESSPTKETSPKKEKEPRPKRSKKKIVDVSA